MQEPSELSIIPINKGIRANFQKKYGVNTPLVASSPLSKLFEQMRLELRAL